MDSTVTVVNRVLVNCKDADRTPISEPFYLGPLDQLTLPFIPIVVVFVYKYPSTSASSSIDSFMPFDRFREAVAHVLDYYPHLTGRIRINPDDKTTEIHQLHTGVEVIQAESHVSIEELEKSKKKALLESTLSSSENCTSGSPSAHHRRLTRLTVNDLPNQGNALLPPFDPTIAGICRNPILTVQHTRFTCGSVAIGVRTSHNICDADGMFLFVRHLAEMYRQLSANTSPDSTVRLTLSHPPLIHSYLAELRLMSPEEKEVAQQFKPTTLEVDETLNWAPFDPPPTTNTIPTDSSLASSTSDESVASSSSSSLSSSPPPPPPPPVVVTGRILHFSKRALAAIKEEANSPTPSSTTAASASLSSPPTSLSTFVALSAHLWRCVYRARVDHALSNGTAIDTFLNQTDAFLTSVNYRTPNRFDLSSQYFPNCVFAPYFSLSHSSLYSGELSDIGKGIHECVRSLSPTDGVRTLRWLSSQSNKRHVRLGFRYEKGGFLVSSWNGFDMIQGCRMDNTPMLASTPFTPISLVDGLVYYLPAPTSTGDQVSHSDADAGAVAVDDNADDDSGGMDVNIALSASVWRQLDSNPNFTRYCSY